MSRTKYYPFPYKYETEEHGTLYMALGHTNAYINAEGKAFSFGSFRFIETGDYSDAAIMELDPLTTHDGRTVYFVEDRYSQSFLIEPPKIFEQIKRIVDVLDNPKYKILNRKSLNYFITTDAEIYKVDDLKNPLPISGPEIKYKKNGEPFNENFYRKQMQIYDFDYIPNQFRCWVDFMEVDPYKSYALKFLGLPYKKNSHLAYVYFYYNNEEDNNARMTYAEEYVIHKDMEDVGKQSYNGERGEYCGDKPLTEHRLQLFDKQINMTNTRIHLLKYYPGYACLYNIRNNTYKVMKCDTGGIVPYYFNEDGIPVFKVYVGERSPYKNLTGFVPLNKLHINPGKLDASTFKLPTGKGKDVKS